MGSPWEDSCKNGVSMQDKQKLRNLIKDAAGNVFYTFAVHWIIVNRLKSKQKWIKIFQIGLTALSTGGFLASILSGVSCLSWLGGLFSAFALALNLYVHEFNIPDDIQKHVDAANELWDVREAYKSLLIDFESLTDEEIRSRRDRLTRAVSRINKAYPGTDEESFRKAQKDIGKYIFEDGEAEKLLHMS